MHELLEIFRSLTKNLDQFTIDHGNTTYAILFAIVFVETGLVIMPFLPGDSLLFAAGAVASRGCREARGSAAGTNTRSPMPASPFTWTPTTRR